MLSLREAAELTGKTKPAILKAIKAGRVSAKKNNLGEWEIDPAELLRVYQQSKPDNDNQQETGLHREIDGLRAEVEKLQQENRELRTDKEQLRADVEEWREQAKAARLMLIDQRPQTSPPAHTEPQPPAEPTPLVRPWLVVLLIMMVLLAGALFFLKDYVW